MNSDKYFLGIAKTIAKQATCPKKQVGCVIVDHDNNIITRGYNTMPFDMQSCIDKPCSDGLNNCHAIHAEAMALVICPFSVAAMHTMYVTLSPCFECAKLITLTGCEKVVYLEDYKSSDGVELLRKNNIEVVKYEN